MEEIASNSFYELKIDKTKNRLYLKVKGFWKDKNDVSNYITDIKEAAENLTKGFTVLADLREMKTPALKINSIHEEAQKTLIQLGLDKTAEVHTELIIKSITKRLSDASKMNKNVFASIEEAEEWLGN